MTDREIQLIQQLYERHNYEPLIVNNVEEMRNRVHFLLEEVNELLESIEDNNFPEVIDALIDIVYVAKGTAVILGIENWHNHFDEVHRANMEKIPGWNEKRPNQVFDLIKPEGWKPPNHLAILNREGKGEEAWPEK